MKTTAFMLILTCAITGVAMSGESVKSETVKELKRLVQAHANGKATVKATGKNETMISCDAMVYHVHSSDRLGRMQKWREELGPNQDGIVIMVTVRSKAYAGALEMPSKLGGPYFAKYFSEVKEGQLFLIIKAAFGSGVKLETRNRILDAMKYPRPKQK